jgi:uncharacterized repeat protein (TIGR02543 family)
MYTSAQITVDLPIKPITFYQEGNSISFKDCALIGDPGRPNLPALKVSVLVPPGVNAADVNVKLQNVTEETISLNGEVVPALPPAARDELVWPNDRVIVNGKDIGVYQKDDFFPAQRLGPTGLGALRQYKIVDITVYTYRYNPVTRVLKRFTSGQVVLSGKGITSLSTLPIITPSNLDLVDAKNGGRIKSMVVNPELMTQYGVQPITPLAVPSSSSAYVIITTDYIVNHSARLLDFIHSKQARGLNVQVITEGTWGGGVGDAASDNIRRWLKNNYLSQKILYALLIGNPDPGIGDVPMKTAWPRYSGNVDRDAPTDYYYAELTGNWDANGDGVVGNYNDFYTYTPGGIDGYAEIAVGRIPYYNSIDQLDHILLKFVNYENTPESSIGWRKNVLLPMEPSDVLTHGYPLGEQIKNDLLIPLDFSFHRVYDTINGYSGSRIDGVLALNPRPESMPCNTNNVVNAWKNSPFGLNVWFTHGSYLSAADVLDLSDIPQLSDLYPSFTFQCSCNNGWPEYSSNLGYSLLNNGAIGTISASRVSYYYPGEVDFSRTASNACMAYGVARCMVVERLPAGEALNRARCGAIGSIPENTLVFNLYGCPEMSLYSSRAQQQERVFAVNSAGNTYTATNGTIFRADVNFTGGSIATSTNQISGTDDDPIYQTERWGNSSYAISGLPQGNYNVVLKFAETYWNAAARRIFDVVIEDQVAIDNLDIFAQVGFNHAYDVTRSVTLNDGTLNVQLTNATADQPKICGFEVYRVINQNLPPVANAGSDQTAVPTNLVTLNGNLSYDRDTGPRPISFLWEQVAGPSVTLTGTSTANPTFTPTLCGNYTLRLTVCDGDTCQIDSTNVTVVNGYILTGVASPVGSGSFNKAGMHFPGDTVMFCVYPRFPYIFTGWSGDATGTADSVAIVMDADKTVTANLKDLNLITLPGRIEAENFKIDYRNEGEGWAYHDLTRGNTGNVFRLYDNVDIEATTDIGGGYDVGWIEAGEWLAYTVNIHSSGLYTFTARVASSVSGTKTMNVTIDGVIAATFSFTDASGSQSWRNIVIPNLTMSAGNHELRMVMVTGGFSLNYLDVTGDRAIYSINATSGANGSITPSGNRVLTQGQNQTFTITPNNGFLVDVLTVDGVNQGSVTSFTFSDINNNHTINATFKSGQMNYTLTTSANPLAGGTLSGNSGTYTAGALASITANPVAGYQFTGWGGDAAGTNNPITITMNANKRVTANFSLIPTYTLSTSANTTAGGTISGNSGTYTSGATATITANPASGYLFTGWSGDATGTTNPVSILMNGNKNVIANFTLQPTLIRQTVSMTNALSSESGTTLSSAAVDNSTTTRWSSAFSDPQWIMFDMGATKTITTVVLDWETANARNYVLEGSNDASFATKQTLKTLINMGTQNHRIDSLNNFSNPGSYRYYRMYGTVRNTTYGYSIYEARFYSSGVAPTYIVTASAGINGTISPNGSVTVNEGSTQAFTITANSGYVIDLVTADGVSQGATGTYTFGNVTANHSIAATFKPAPVYFTLTVTPGNGTVTLSPNASSYASGTTVTLTATPHTGFSFSSWTGAANNTVNPTTVVMNGNRSVSANYTPIATYTVNASAAANGTITPTGAVLTNVGTTRTFTITPNANYTVDQVLVDGTNAGSVTTYTFGTTTTGTHIIAATFKTSGPMRIQAEDYKTGGEGVGYHDLTAGNTGGAYKPNDNVDIETTSDVGGIYNVGWTDNGEWLAYDINVAQTGSYKITARLASGQAGTKTLTMTLDGNPLTTISTSVSSGWQVWSDVSSSSFSLTAGAHVLRVTTSGGLNLNYFEVATATTSNLITNGDFENSGTGWTATGAALGSVSYSAGTADWTIVSGAGQVYEPQMIQGVSLVSGRQYTLCFDIRTDESARNIDLNINGDADNSWANRGLSQSVPVTTSWVRQTYTFTSNATDATSRLDFNLGANANDVIIDNVKLVEGATCN